MKDILKCIEAYDAGCWFRLKGKDLGQAVAQSNYWGIYAENFLSGYQDGFITCPIG